MGRRTRVALATLFVLAVSAPAANAARDSLNAYRVAPTADNKSALALKGFDMTEADHGRYLEIYGTAGQIADLRQDGISTRLVGEQRAAAAQRRRAAADRQRRRIQCLAALRPRRGRHEGAVPRAVRPARGHGHRQEGRAGQDRPGPRHRRAQGHEERQGDDRQHASRGALQRDAARTRVAGGRDLPAHAPLLHPELRQGDRRGRDRHPARRLARAVVPVRQQPGRLRVHVHARQPPVAQEPRRQRRRRRLRRDQRRRRPEPQPRHELGPRQRGLERRPDVGDLPRPGAELRAGDEGVPQAVEHGRLQVPEERPHRGGAAPVAAGLPAVHADAGQRAVRGARR